MKYTIFSIDDSRQNYIKNIDKKLVGWTKVRSWCVDGRDSLQLQNAMADHPYDVNVNFRVGQLGIWYTVLNALEHAPLVTFEDDAIIGPRFKQNWTIRTFKLPDDWDFFSLFIPRDSDHLYTEDLSAGPYITKTYQRYGGVSMYYSKRGVEKFKALLARDGLTQQYDETLYAYAKSGELNGYCSKPEYEDLVYISGTERSIVQESEPWNAY